MIMTFSSIVSCITQGALQLADAGIEMLMSPLFVLLLEKQLTGVADVLYSSNYLQSVFCPISFIPMAFLIFVNYICVHQVSFILDELLYSVLAKFVAHHNTGIVMICWRCRGTRIIFWYHTSIPCWSTCYYSDTFLMPLLW